MFPFTRVPFWVPIFGADPVCLQDFYRHFIQYDFETSGQLLFRYWSTMFVVCLLCKLCFLGRKFQTFKGSSGFVACVATWAVSEAPIQPLESRAGSRNARVNVESMWPPFPFLRTFPLRLVFLRLAKCTVGRRRFDLRGGGGEFPRGPLSVALLEELRLARPCTFSPVARFKSRGVFHVVSCLWSKSLMFLHMRSCFCGQVSVEFGSLWPCRRCAARFETRFKRLAGTMSYSSARGTSGSSLWRQGPKGVVRPAPREPLSFRFSRARGGTF